MILRRTIPAFLPLLLLLSCAGDTAGPPGLPTRDVIAGDSPILQLGVREGRVEEQFHVVHNLVAFGDTALAVVDSGAQELRLFSLDGAYLRSVGGSGDGPGEFRAIYASWAHEEGGVEVADGIGWRTTHFDPSLDHATHRLFRDPDWPFLMAGFSGRSGSRWVIQTNDLVPFPPPEEAMTLTNHVRVFDPEHGFTEEAIAARSVIWYTPPAGRSVRVPIHLTPLPRVRGGLGVVGALDPHAHTLSLIREGESWTHVELPQRCLPLPDEVFAPGEAGDEARGGIPLEAFRTFAPECLPSYDLLAWTNDHRFWVRETPSNQVSGGWDGWLVYEVGASTLYRTSLPGGFLPMAVAGDMLLGRWLDEMDVHFVRGYRLVSPRTAPP